VDGGGSALKKAMIRAGLEHKNVTPHSTRHTFATWLKNRHVDRHDIMELGGWTTLHMMTHYTHTDGDELAPAASKIPSLNLQSKGSLRLIQAAGTGKFRTKSTTVRSR
jgi:integrase